MIGRLGRRQRVQLVDQQTNVERFGKVSQTAGAHRLQTRFDIVPRRHEDHGQFGAELFPDQLHGFDAGKPALGKNDIGDNGGRFLAVDGRLQIGKPEIGFDVVAEMADLNGQVIRKILVVFDQIDQSAFVVVAPHRRGAGRIDVNGAAFTGVLHDGAQGGQAGRDGAAGGDIGRFLNGLDGAFQGA